MPGASKKERLQVFLGRLEMAAPASSGAQARRLLEDILNKVEDEMTDIPYNPELPRTDGRQYAPQDDAAREVAGYPAVTRYRSRSHNTFISEGGAIEIRDLDEQVLLTKPDADGNGVWA